VLVFQHPTVSSRQPRRPCRWACVFACRPQVDRQSRSSI